MSDILTQLAAALEARKSADPKSSYVAGLYANSWRQVFDTAAERQGLAKIFADANEQNLDRLAAEVLDVR